ncbi:MAG: tRNA-dependent cyclodipeptide synthase [Flavobacteriaceae bacterium]
MKLVKLLNIESEQLSHGNEFIYFGISLNNKYFSDLNIREHIKWSVENSKHSILIIIADDIHSFNYQSIYNLGEKEALKKARISGKEERAKVEEVIGSLPHKTRELIKIIHWRDIHSEPIFQKRLRHVKDYFAKNLNFQEACKEVTIKSLGQGFIHNVGQSKLPILVNYVLSEIAAFADGVWHKGDVYRLHSYPGLSELDDLLIDINTSTRFPDLTKNLEITGRISVIEGYANDFKEVKVSVGESQIDKKGLIARRRIFAGEIVYSVSGTIIDCPTRYTFPISNCLYIDPYGFDGQYQNHSCSPNCGIRNRNQIVALRDIEKGDEITIDYAMIGFSYGNEISPEELFCNCGSPECRGRLGCFQELPLEKRSKYEGFISSYLTVEK